MTAGDEQCSLLMLQCELTVLSQPRVPYCMKEGKIPVLIWLLTSYLHCICTLKGWKKLAENKEKKNAALKMKEAAVHCLVKQKDLQPAQETKPSSIHHYLLWVWWKQQLWAKQKNFDCLCLFPLQSRKFFFLKRKHLWVLFWGLCLKMCEHFDTVEHKFPRKPLLQNFRIEKPGNTFSTGSCRTGKALLKPFLKQQST